jgi:hypothetical protein
MLIVGLVVDAEKVTVDPMPLLPIRRSVALNAVVPTSEYVGDAPDDETRFKVGYARDWIAVDVGV